MEISDREKTWETVGIVYLPGEKYLVTSVTTAERTEESSDGDILETVKFDYNFLDRGGNPRLRRFTAGRFFTEENGS